MGMGSSLGPCVWECRVRRAQGGQAVPQCACVAVGDVVRNACRWTQSVQTQEGGIGEDTANVHLYVWHNVVCAVCPGGCL